MQSNTETKKVPAPRLRFPEFEVAGEWEEKKLFQIASSVTTRATAEDTHSVLTLSGEFGLIKQGDYFGKKIAGEAPERYIRIIRDDFVYNDRVTKASEYGTIKRLDKYDAGIVSPIYKCFRFKTDESKVFWQYYFESGLHNAELKNFANEGARAGRFNISIDKFLTTSVNYPSIPEQTRIAATLSSLDTVIAAQTDKLAALRDHKQGLMQGLFPAEGERMPRLRFPEFAGAGEWEITTLGDIATITSGATPNRAVEKYWNGNIPWITTSLINSNIIETASEYITEAALKETSVKLFPKDTVLIAMYGQGITRGKVSLLGFESTTNQACASLICNQKINPNFLFQNLVGRYKEIRDLSNSGGQENLSLGLISSISFSFATPSEQTHIAAALSSLDALITAQGEKVKALQTFKFGLMQGLFPGSGEE